MKLSEATRLYLLDRENEGLALSTLDLYGRTLHEFSKHVRNRDPGKVGRDEVKSFMANPKWGRGTRADRLSQLRAFYDWYVEEGYGKHNPAREVRRPKRPRTTPDRLTRVEADAMLPAADGTREQLAVALLLNAGLRRSEARGAQGRDVRRGFLHVRPELAKGGHERYVPVDPILASLIERRSAAPNEYLVHSRRKWSWQGVIRIREIPDEPMSPIWWNTTIRAIGLRATGRRVHPHLLRHAFADHVARRAGVQIASYVLGHVSLSTTQVYLARPTLEEVAAALSEPMEQNAPVIALRGGQGADERTRTSTVPRTTAS